MKEDCHICGVKFDSSESVFSDVCKECADEISEESAEESK